MPSPSSTPLGALPARFRRPRVLVVGCGDVGLRAAAALSRPVRVLALTSSPARAPLLRARGIVPLAGDLDLPATLARLAGLATHVLHLAPPGDAAPGADPRTRALIAALRRRGLPRALVYGSTSGVYGDCGGAEVSELRTPAPATARARRRVDAERQVRRLARSGVAAMVLRIPGIYAEDREGGTPRARLARGTPALVAQDDVYTSHIHADDLARACVAALWRGRPGRVVNVADDTRMRMGEYFDFAAARYGLPPPPRITRAQAAQELSPMLMSFMSESRRLDNTRMKRELRLALRYPTVADGLRAP